ncbi:MAG TPA: hypothetical protein VLB07_07260 [Woeseiaceae bacterium]|nr:hypothetical protein [Woeseiaceae bacterium]
MLVTSEGRVSLLDFGVAKLLDPAGFPGAQALKRTGISLLTPGYASPEQLAGKAGRIWNPRYRNFANRRRSTPRISSVAAYKPLLSKACAQLRIANLPQPWPPQDLRGQNCRKLTRPRRRGAAPVALQHWPWRPRAGSPAPGKG